MKSMTQMFGFGSMKEAELDSVELSEPADEDVVVGNTGEEAAFDLWIRDSDWYVSRVRGRRQADSIVVVASSVDREWKGREASGVTEVVDAVVGVEERASVLVGGEKLGVTKDVDGEVDEYGESGSLIGSWSWSEKGGKVRWSIVSGKWLTSFV